MVIFWILLYIKFIYADLPIHCLNVEVAGKWKFERSQTDSSFQLCGYHAPDRNSDHFKKHTYNFVASTTFEVELVEPNILVDSNNNHIGTWTMVYDEGFEARIGNESYFAFQMYEGKGSKANLLSTAVSDYISHCDKTMVGWFHQVGGEYWGCWQGTKISSDSSLNLHQKDTLKITNSNVVSPRALVEGEVHQTNVEFVEMINNDPASKWKATVYPMFENVQVGHLTRMLGAKQFTRKRGGRIPRSLIDTRSDAEKYGDLPRSWDWRNVNGVNFDSPVRNQGGCGSCYAHATVNALESRFRVASQNQLRPSFSVQNVLDCSIWNQACEGGYPFLVARHAQAFGLVDEKCQEYKGADQDCETDFFLTKGKKKPGKTGFISINENSHLNTEACLKRYFVKDYHYVGGFYGGCNEVAMMKEIKENGPVTVAFQAPPTLFYYNSGVFDHTGDGQRQDEGPGINIWEQTNHAVTAVGWGELEDHTKYWILKNTWGELWGEKGYFRILRGVDLCAVESMSVAATVALPEQEHHEYNDLLHLEA